MAKRAVILLRVSGKQQDEEMQLPDCIKYCENHKFKIVADPIRDKISGTVPVADRPGGKQVYDLLKRKAIDVVVMWTLDRAARDESVTEYLVFKRDVRHYGAELHFTDTGKTSDDPYQSIVEFATAAGASAERLKIVKRTRTGRERKFNEKHQIVLNGEPAFGYRKIGIQKEAYLVIDDVEGGIVCLVFRLYVQERLGLWEILKIVSDSGVSPRRAGVGKFSDKWNKRKIIQILHYRGYKGEFTYAGNTLYKPELAMVDTDTWEKAQKFLKANQWMHDKNHNYLMAGRVQCHCGGTLSGVSHSKNSFAYRCVHGQYFPVGSPERCTYRIVGSRIDKLVWGWLSMLAASPDGFTRIVDDMVANIEKEIQPLKNRIESLDEMIDDTDKQIKRMIRRVTGIEDDDEAAPYQVEINRLTESKRGLTAQRDTAQAEIDQYSWILNGKVDPNAVVAEMNGILKCKTTEEKRRSIERFDVRAQLVKEGDEIKKVKLSCYLAPKGVTLNLDDPMYSKVIGIVFDEPGTASGIISNNEHCTHSRGIYLSEILPLSLADEFFAEAVKSAIVNQEALQQA